MSQERTCGTCQNYRATLEGTRAHDGFCRLDNSNPKLVLKNNIACENHSIESTAKTMKKKITTKPKPMIAQATSFKVSYVDAESPKDTMFREFKSIRTMNQWIERNMSFAFFVMNKFALIDGNWEAFTTIGKKTVTLSELKKIVAYLED